MGRRARSQSDDVFRRVGRPVRSRQRSHQAEYVTTSVKPRPDRPSSGRTDNCCNAVGYASVVG